MTVEPICCFECGNTREDVAESGSVECYCRPVPCPACDGDGCRHCGKQGWTDEEDAKQIEAFLDSQRETAAVCA